MTTRAWKLKNAFLKWVGVFLTGSLTLIPLALLVLALIGFSMLNKHYDNPVVAIQVDRTPAQIARGEQLAHACSNCHSPGNELPLSGSNFGEKFEMPPLGTLYAPNLTPSGDIQDWSDGELIRAIREGIHKDGRSLLIMPSDNFRSLSDEDVQAIVAYLRSQPAIGDPTPITQFSMLGAVFMNLSDFRVAQKPTGRVSTPTNRNGGIWQVYGGCDWLPGLPRRPITRESRQWPTRSDPRSQPYQDRFGVDGRTIYVFFQYR